MPKLSICFSILLSLICGAALAADQPVARPSKGDIPPRYAGSQFDGTEINIEPGAGKAYVISFWANWCPPCIEELPVLSNIQRAAGPDKMQVIAINIQERDIYRKLEQHIGELGITSTYDPTHKAHDAYGVGSIPHMIIIGRDGRITSVRTGYSSSTLEGLAAVLNRALAASPKNADTRP